MSMQAMRISLRLAVLLRVLLPPAPRRRGRGDAGRVGRAAPRRRPAGTARRRLPAPPRLRPLRVALGRGSWGSVENHSRGSWPSIRSSLQMYVRWTALASSMLNFSCRLDPLVLAQRAGEDVDRLLALLGETLLLLLDHAAGEGQREGADLAGAGRVAGALR